ncbi:activity-dependent neuroprotector homeobox protein 2 [Desmodus rotundus]|uniref:Putative vesicle coat complex copii subunit sec31 n=1 Tax=Desmodus rotundus TaxID=9430 RepID=K9IPX5_DESRO|nr:activity-dependent neuroprotector homeobox protein 2 [Desmodus rotundus]XP_053768861.1 activity-dependent neuroprotector homeobox protein 2 [Desmodus rotundus]XP_053768863.1 activity-dependent neuroprotector homeobox protein 2 [Desmodus rotundus]XP_053768864.1 activity-dependent neuroprotector homeobox protein 2 [Desmodus rotundus]XP_053768865.1 activity-dependent neuroprotector homeobox protein 2 [Desmodus rotundus]XP_053768866.1 activity-dependent neuroprotector homeobox protein 2 [Desmod
MFQIPVENLDSIRKARKKVKGILVDIGLESCKELLQDLKGFDPGEKYFYNTSWGDISLWEPSGKKVRYRTKPYCCGLCKYSTKVLTSFKNHLHRYHEDEIDQELVIPCPNCVFSSQPKVVGRHFRMFHAPVRKVQNYTVNILGETKSSRSDVISFTCLKCNFSNTLYYSMKKHVLVAHFHYLINSYFGLRTEEVSEQPRTDDSSSTEKMPPSDKYYCKKCNANASSQDALMYHILTSDTHRDLENKLRSVISEHIKKTGLLKQMHIAPKPVAHLAIPPSSSALGVPATSPCFHLALPPSSQSQTAVQPVQGTVQPVTVTSGVSGSLTHSPPSTAQSHVTLVSSPLPGGQSGLTLPPAPPQPVFLSPGVPLHQPANPPVLPLSRPVGPVKSVGTGVLPMSQTIRPGVLPLSRPVGPVSRPVGSGVLSVNRPVGSAVLPVSPSVTPGVLQAVSPGVISVSRTVPSGVLPAGQMTPAGVIPSGQTATSGVLPAGQMVQSGVLPIGQTAPSGVLPPGLTVPPRPLPPGQTVPLRVLPAGQVVPPGLLSSNQTVSSSLLPGSQGVNSGVLHLSQPVVSGVLPVSQPGRPGVLQLSQSVNTNILPANQPVRPGASQNTAFLTSGSILRQLIPTGKQVNGIPTYTLAPVSVTLPVPPGGVTGVTPPQVPIQLLQSGTASQMAGPMAGMPSPPVVVNAAPSVFLQPSSSAAEVNPGLKPAKQWKTCPVCNELFPSNVYQVHMEVAHKHSESRAVEKLEPEKLAACAPFLKWMREKTVRCLSCKCMVSEEELMHHLLTHGLGCLFCPRTFHDIKGLAEHSRTTHLGKKKLPVDYSNKGFQLDIDANGNLLFPHLDFITVLPKEELGEREVYLAVLAGIYSKSLVPVYIKVRPQLEGVPGGPSKQVLTCPFCFGTFLTTEAYELHLKDRHHITPTVHTILKSPAFKCIHCCGVYTGNMTLAAIAIHLLRCRSAPKDSSSDLQVQPDLIENSELLLVNGEVVHDSSFAVKRKLPEGHSGAEDPREGEQRPLVINSEAAPAPEKVTSVVPFKRQRNESRTEGPLVVSEDALQILALNPKKYEDRSYEEKKQFLKDYFHKRPYPSKKEIELLSSLLWVWKIDVASFFGKRRYICMKAIKSHKPSVLLGFDMSELKNVKHRLNFDFEPQNV